MVKKSAIIASAIISILLISSAFSQLEKEKAPPVEAEAPAVKTEAPVVKEEAPAVEEKAPAVKTEAPAVKEEAPAVKAKPLACIIDLDGTIADESKRREEAAGKDGKLSGKEYEAYFDPSKVPGDKPLPTSRETLFWLDGQDITIFYVSSRPATMLEASKTWIRENDFPSGKDVFHKEDKYEKSLKYKTRIIKDIEAKGYDVLFGVGDRDKDIQSYEAAGITAIKVAPNTDEDWNRVRSKIEEILKNQAAPKQPR